MDKEKVQTDISLIDIWHKLLKHKILIVAITLIVAIIGFFTIFTYNKANAVIINEFTYEFKGVDKERYPDGSIFDFIDLSNDEYLTQVKNKNIKFENIDINKLINNSNFKFLVIKVPISNNENEFKTHYRIEMPIKHFGSQAIAEEFIKEFHNTVLADVLLKNKTLNIVNYFDFENFDHFAENLTYGNIINMFILQNKIITDSSEIFLTNYEQVNTTIDDVNYNLEVLLQNYNIWYKESVRPNQLLQEVFKNGYIRNLNETLRLANARLIEIDREHKLNEELIQKLHYMALSLGLPGNSESDVFYREIEKLVIKNTHLEQERDDLKRITDNPETNTNEEFDDLIEEISVSLKDFVNNYNKVTNNYLNENVRYRRLNTHDYSVLKPYKLLMMTALLGIGGLVVSSAIALSLKDEDEIE